MSKQTKENPVTFAKLVEELISLLHKDDYQDNNVMVSIHISRNRFGKVTGCSKRIVKIDDIPDNHPGMEVNHVHLYFLSKGKKKKHILQFPKYSKEVWDFLMGDQAKELSVKEVDLRDVRHQEFKWLNSLPPIDRRLERGGKVREFTLDTYEGGIRDEEDESEVVSHNIDADSAFGLGELFEDELDDFVLPSLK